MTKVNLSRREVLRYGGLLAGTALTGLIWQPGPSVASNLGNGIPGPIAHDASGLITVQLFYYRSFIPHQHFMEYSVDVAGDMVAVGGGVVGTEDPGALIYSSHPNDDLSSWMIGTKDHLIPDSHFVSGYAIGMKIQGMSKKDLVESMLVTTTTSEKLAHPTVMASLPGDYALLGGGLRVDWDGSGNLATASYPVGVSAWEARSKDHGDPDPSNLTVFAIGIKRQLPVGVLGTTVAQNKSGVSPIPISTATLPPGYALCGGGGFVDWHGQGSLLWRLQPDIQSTGQSFIAASKEHGGFADSEAITAYAIGAYITPA